MVIRFFLIDLFAVGIDWCKIVLLRITIKIDSLVDLDALNSKGWSLLTFQIEDIGPCLVPYSQQITESLSQHHCVLASFTLQKCISRYRGA